jgi:predicted Zn-dependent protease
MKKKARGWSDRLRRTALALAAGGFGLAAFATGVALPAATPARAAAAVDLVSERQELEAGREAAAQVEQKYRVVTGTREARLVEQIGRRMAAVSGRPNLPWRFRVIEERALNAFSVPGYVYLHTGLIDAIGDDTDALAGVIAHEVAHTDARHSKKQMEKGAVAGLLGAIITGGDRRKAGWFNLAGNVVLLKFSRDDEYQADRLAVGYMNKTGHDPNGLIRFFQKLQRMEGRGGTPEFFRTHPNSGNRVARIRSLIAGNR